MANVMTRPDGRKRILFSTFVVRMQTTSFLLMTKILCVAGRKVPLDDKTESNHNKLLSLL